VTFRALGHGFPNGMTAPDRELLMNYLYTELIANGFDWTILYAGLEDGTFIYYTDPYSADFREPGNGGFDASNITENDVNYKNYISCVDETGQSADCTLELGSSYIECVSDCELIPCQTITMDPTATTTTTTTNNATALTATKLCRNYIVQQVQENEVRGYIPDTYFCIDQSGQPEQQPGTIWKAPPDEDTTQQANNVVVSSTGVNGIYDNCYYDDGVTLVNRSTLYGSYESCGTPKKGIYGSCNTAFIGGYSSPEYDARYRDWYVNTKIAQESIWTPPYTFSFANAMGITYSQPI
jgi:hypothetical protein